MKEEEEGTWVSVHHLFDRKKKRRKERVSCFVELWIDIHIGVADKAMRQLVFWITPSNHPSLRSMSPPYPPFSTLFLIHFFFFYFSVNSLSHLNFNTQNVIISITRLRALFCIFFNLIDCIRELYFFSYFFIYYIYKF